MFSPAKSWRLTPILGMAAIAGGGLRVVEAFPLPGVAPAMLLRGAFPKLAPALWIASLILGAIGLLPPLTALGMAAAGVAFGVGFVAAGITLVGEQCA